MSKVRCMLAKENRVTGFLGEPHPRGDLMSALTSKLAYLAPLSVMLCLEVLGAVPMSAQGGDGAWSWREDTTGRRADLNGVWGASPSDVFAVGAGGAILHWDGRRWRSQQSGTSEHLTSVWGRSGSDVFAVGTNGAIVRYDGRRWRSELSPASAILTDVWGADSTVFAASLGGHILRRDQSGWSVDTVLPVSLFDRWGPSATDVWAIGAGGTIFHFDGSGWAVARDTVVSTMVLNAVWGRSSNDVWAVGWEDEIYCAGDFCVTANRYSRMLHWDGSAWTRTGDVLGFGPIGIAGFENEVFIVGGHARRSGILHWAGERSEWVESPVGSFAPLTYRDVWVAPNGDVFVVGDRGVVVVRSRAQGG